MLHFRVNIERMRGAFRTARARRRAPKRGVLHWATGGPSMRVESTIEERLDDVEAVNAERGTGYNSLVGGGVLYPVSDVMDVMYHCGGSSWSNESSYAVSILYMGPSRRKRKGIEGQLLRPHHSLGEAWYPPIALEDIFHAAYAFRRVGVTEVKGHWEIHPTRKNDPRPINMDVFRKLVDDNEFWAECVNSEDIPGIFDP